jgi:hypothetical protein
MSAVAKISFLVEPIFEHGPPRYAFVPAINGTALTGLVTAFESERHFDKVGGYAGIVPKFFNYGPLDRYFLGRVVPDLLATAEWHLRPGLRLWRGRLLATGVSSQTGRRSRGLE